MRLWAWVWKAQGITYLIQLGGSVGGKGRKDLLIPEVGSSCLPRVSVPSSGNEYFLSGVNLWTFLHGSHSAPWNLEENFRFDKNINQRHISYLFHTQTLAKIIHMF